MVFASFCERGLEVLAHPFLRALLHHYHLELQHLNPNGLLHVTAFITFCECFLGVQVNFLQWVYFFTVRIESCLTLHSGGGTPISGAGIRLRGGKGKDYFDLPSVTSNKEWHREWFYVSNPSLSLPPFTGGAPTVEDSWTCGVPAANKKGVDRIPPIFREHVLQGIADAGLLWEFFSQCIQPVKQRAHEMFRHSGPQDPTRVRPEELPDSEVRARVRSSLAGGGGVDVVLGGHL